VFDYSWAYTQTLDNVKGKVNMAKMTQEMQEMFNRMGCKQLATAAKNGVPNVVPINFMKIVDAETILASAVFMTKTFNNLKENPICAISIWEGFAGFQFKGTAAVVTDGPVYKETAAWTEEEGKKLGLPLKSKAAIVIKITDIFSVAPGEDAGKKIA
jgi:predicted pyridoxine 5'-phosphate oxidase superfamily flavin-nucleotide-binding protein